MPGKGKTKKFIDKKNAVTFYLAHRSQHDPLIADETAPQRVLVPLDQAGGGNSGHGTSADKAKADAKKRKEQQKEYGVYFDDDYDYLQHLKNSEEVSNIEWDFKERVYAPSVKSQPEEQPKCSKSNKEVTLKFPSSVFESEYEEKIGLLNKAVESRGPRPDLDPDVLAALDDDFDFDNSENQLEDNFIELANDSSVDQGKKSLFSDDDSEGEERDTVGELDDRFSNSSSDDGDGEGNTRFTNYSMSSSVVRRNEQLTLLDDRFEKMFEDYDDTEIGALDCDEIEGHLNPQSDLLLQYAEKFEQEQSREINLNEKIEKLVLKQTQEEEEFEDHNMDSDFSDSEEVPKEKWDCESIISTYSTTKNRPKLIREPSKRNVIKISGKTSLPVGVLGLGLTKERLKELDSAYDMEQGSSNNEPNAKSMITTISAMRNKNETPDERSQRKKLLREYRNERRIERKANINAFKDEKKRQVKIRLNNVANVQGLKI